MSTRKHLKRGTRITKTRHVAPLPPSLAIESIHFSLYGRGRVAIVLTPFERDGSTAADRIRELMTGRCLMDESMVGADILPGDLLLYDGHRTTPTDGAIMWVRDGEDYVPRIARVDGDMVAYHPAAEGYPVLSG